MAGSFGQGSAEATHKTDNTNTQDNAAKNQHQNNMSKQANLTSHVGHDSAEDTHKLTDNTNAQDNAAKNQHQNSQDLGSLDTAVVQKQQEMEQKKKSVPGKTTTQ